MPNTADVEYAKKHLAELIQEAIHGGEVILLLTGTPVARLIPYTPEHPDRKPGHDEGRVIISDDFAPLSEFAAI
jgi:antitoxin (DNA-binding transcriptional repressor) of toxin-antitoxin stability system